MLCRSRLRQAPISYQDDHNDMTMSLLLPTLAAAAGGVEGAPALHVPRRAHRDAHVR